MMALSTTWKPEFEEAIREELGNRKDLELIIAEVRDDKDWPLNDDVHMAVKSAIGVACQRDHPEEADLYRAGNVLAVRGMPSYFYYWIDYDLRMSLAANTHAPHSHLWCIAQLSLPGDDILTSIARVGCLCGYGGFPESALGWHLANEYGGAVISPTPPQSELGRPQYHAANSRRVMWYLARQYTDLRLREVGDIFGGYTAAAVSSAISQSMNPLCWPHMLDQFTQLMLSDIDYRAESL